MYVKEASAFSFLVEYFYNSSKVVVDVILLHGGPQGSVPHLVDENAVQVLLVLEVFLTDKSEVHYLLYDIHTCPEIRLFSAVIVSIC